jgi:hypothetical protein
MSAGVEESLPMEVLGKRPLMAPVTCGECVPVWMRAAHSFAAIRDCSHFFRGGI